MNLLFLVHLSACWFMTGVIWLVQVLIYPNFRLIGDKQFTAFHEFHTQRITWVVAPAMGLELASGIGLLWTQSDSVYFWNFLSVFVVWLLTGLVSVPLHHRIHRTPDLSKNSIVWSNWPRTAVWSLRALFLTWLAHHQILGGP